MPILEKSNRRHEGRVQQIDGMRGSERNTTEPFVPGVSPESSHRVQHHHHWLFNGDTKCLRDLVCLFRGRGHCRDYVHCARFANVSLTMSIDINVANSGQILGLVEDRVS